MTFVVDASVTLAWYFADESSAIADMALGRLDDAEAVAPVVWWFEVRNALLINERHGRIDATQTAEIIAHLESLPIRLDGTRKSEALLALARAHRLTAYDAAYLEIARRLDAPLATLDRALDGAARAAGVPLLDDAPA